MAEPTLDPHPPDRLADRLAAARRRRFVGRAAELDLFRAALAAPQPPFALLHIYGPGGLGKTALLAEFARVAEEVGVLAVRLDGRHLDPSPAGFRLGLGRALGLGDGDSPLVALASQPRVVLLLDTYETLAPLDDWLREEFLPQLPDQTLVVVAGRAPPAPAWRSDPGWSEMLRVVPLRNLRPEESRAYLRARQVPDERQGEVLAFTHGHPLALSLVADAFAHGDARPAATAADAPDVVRVLLQRFVERVPTPLHRRAIDACAHIRLTTEPMLAAALDLPRPDAHDLFEWLRGLSFVEQGPDGLFPHDLAREVLDADLRWRNPDGYRDLHRRVRNRVVHRLQTTAGRERQQAVVDLLYLHRGNPIMRPAHDWATLGHASAEPATPTEVPFILDTVRRHEGDASAEIARYWTERPTATFTLFRAAGGEPVGFAAFLALHAVTPEDAAADPAVRAAHAFALRYSPARPGEAMLLHRYHMGRATYQTASSAMNMMALTSTTHWITIPRLAWSFLAIGDADYWHPIFSYLNFARSPEAAFVVGGRRYEVYTHDWRAEPPLAWLDLMADREIATGLKVEELEAPAPPPLIVLSRPEFDAAVRQALRDYTRPDALTANPLLRSRVATERTASAPTPATLRALVDAAVAPLRANPKDQKLYRAMHRTFLEPAASQELAAEALDLPFSTYRYHLSNGIQRIADWLWQRELFGGDAE